MANYPLPKFHFQVEWGGAKLGFTEVTGLEVSTEVIEYRDGTDLTSSKRKMPGQKKYGNVTMKRGTFEGDNDFYKWWNTVALNTVERRNVIISLLNEKHEPVITWRLTNAWASKVTSTDLKADGNEVAIETIEIVHEGLVIENN